MARRPRRPSTPRQCSAQWGPPHSHSSLGRHSRESSSTRFSGSLKPNNSSKKAEKGAGRKPWNKECAVIEEEGLLDEDEADKSLPRKCYLLAFVSIKFEQFVIQAGSDSTGVATDMVSMNSTVKLTFRNTATFLGSM
ncbi:hypothetical protein Scep_020267 [Stephania cephalantha]|uniref:Uncharacterized protein n=1 Tax=Stephania cephalantha TaxID=152367 RepID=A0AAP0NN11_9MAGN